MMSISGTCRLVWIGLVGLALSGCISLFPKSEPSQLYRFGGVATSEGQTPSNSTTKVNFVRSGGAFALAAASDGILTTTGTEVAYLAGARWAQPAPVLFEEGLVRAFSTNQGPARLVIRGEPARAAYSMRLDVQQFEAVYDRPGNAAPEVRIDIHLVLVRPTDRTVIYDQVTSIRERARGARVSDIVSAFDAAVAQALTTIIDVANKASAG